MTTSPVKIRLEHDSGLRAELTNFGATLMRLQVPNMNGELQDVVVGFEDPISYDRPPYTQHNFCIGATIGRYAGRISRGGFELEGKQYRLPNEEGVHLHGGTDGFDKQLWSIVEENHGENPYVLFELKSPDGHSGYPGNLIVRAKFQLTADSLLITYEAESDSTTVLNLTNHAYFHLDSSGSVSGNTLFINAESLLGTDERLLPTGKFKAVENTPYDYHEPKALQFDGHFGLDTPFPVSEGPLAARLYSKTSGIRMEVITNQPAVVVFTPQEFPALGLRGQQRYKRFPAICFECQNYPDAPNHESFPSSVLEPGETYLNEIQYRFSTE